MSLNPLLTNVVKGDALTSSLTAGQVVKAVSSFCGPFIAAFAAGTLGNWQYLFPIFALITLLSAAWLIDKAGCKPLTRGGAALWPAQPLVIVNATGRATGADVVALEQAVINRVAERFGVTLHPEVIHIG